MFNKMKLARSGRRSELSAGAPSHYTKESTMPKSILTALIAAVVMLGLTVASASADSHGQCNERFGNVAHSTSQWEHMLSSEGVLGEAESQIFASAGFNHFDQTVSQWLSQRVMIGSAVKAFRGPDKGCENGHLFDAHMRSYEKGKSMFWVLPKQYKKSRKGSPGNFATHRTKTFSRRIVIRVKAIGMPECGNPIPVEIVVEIWVQVSHKKPVKKPVVPVTPPPPAVTPPPPAAPIVCVAPLVMTASGCANQENHAEQHCLEQGGNWNSGTALCTIIQVNGNCSNIIVINGSGNTVNNYQEGNCKVEEKKTPTCLEADEVGTFPNCRPRTCEELGTCKPPPSPPKIVSVSTINDVDATGFSENFCVTVEMPGSDTGTLIMSPRYGNFGLLGGKVTFTVSGIMEECVTYYAPTEVPPGGKDKMTVTLRDNNTGTPATPDEQEFRINPAPVNPS